MLLKFVLVLLPLSPFTNARTDQLDNRENYLRKLKKDTYFQNDGDQGLISMGMMKTFETSQNGLTFGDWMNHYNATASSGRVGLNGVDGIVRVSTFSESDDLYSTDDDVDAPFTNDSDPIASSETVGWNNGATAVSAKRSGILTFKIPDTTHVGDTLFLFLRCVTDMLSIQSSLTVILNDSFHTVTVALTVFCHLNSTTGTEAPSVSSLSIAKATA
jgi:hypothetical protein